MGFQEKLKYLTFSDPEGARSLVKTLDMEYLDNGAR